ncbi:hypothetical protein WJX72_003985 [[Myrmecia] bisecta]|uniref:Uncharacterized protein n=1 Tax=[Myrmecia] bisecta TaxID=41462 RepID=A0AAW1Q054_9CHLO
MDRSSLGRALRLIGVVLGHLTADFGLEGGSLNPGSLLSTQAVLQSCTWHPGPDDFLFTATLLVSPTPSWHLQHANDPLPGMRRAQTSSAPGTRPGTTACSLWRV